MSCQLQKLDTLVNIVLSWHAVIPQSCIHSRTSFRWKTVICDSIHIHCIPHRLFTPIYVQCWRYPHHTYITVPSLSSHLFRDSYAFCYNRLPNSRKQELEGLHHDPHFSFACPLTCYYSGPNRAHNNSQGLFQPWRRSSVLPFIFCSHSTLIILPLWYIRVQKRLAALQKLQTGKGEGIGLLTTHPLYKERIRVSQL